MTAPLIPSGGSPIRMRPDGVLDVPDHPIVPYIEGDGTGPDIWRASVRVVDTAVEKEYGGRKKIAWTEVYAGVEWPCGSPEAIKLIDFLQKEMGVTKIRFPETSGIGIKPVSREGTERLVRKAIQYAIDNDKPSLTLVHKGNIMKFTEGAFRDWGYGLAQKEFAAEPLDGGPWMSVRNPRTGGRIVVKDVIADAFLQQILLRPAEYSVIATLNLNGDYISDALAAQVGGIGIAPGANMSDSVAMFEATHGTAPKYAGKDYVNPGSEILSAEMMLTHMGWKEAAALIVTSLERSIADKVVTYDFARLMPGATQVSCSGFGNAMIERM